MQESTQKNITSLIFPKLRVLPVRVEQRGGHLLMSLNSPVHYMSLKFQIRQNCIIIEN